MNYKLGNYNFVGTFVSSPSIFVEKGGSTAKPGEFSDFEEKKRAKHVKAKRM